MTETRSRTRRIRAWATGAAALAMAASGAVGTPTARASYPGVNGKIAFTAISAHKMEIFTMNATGSNKTRITDTLRENFDPSWNFDSSKIYFTAVPPKEISQIFSMDKNGNLRTQVTSGDRDFDFPVASPDGTKIVASEIRNNGFEQIVVMRSDGTHIKRLTNNKTDDVEPDWNFDGTKIIFERDRKDGDADVMMVNPDGSALHRVTNGKGTDIDPSFKPDGTQIAFSHVQSNGTGRIKKINSDGTGQRQVRDNSAVYHALVGWADSDHLVITEPGPEGVIIKSLGLWDGSTSDLFTMSSNKADTVVSQDGQWIAFTSSLGGMLGNGLYVSHPDGSQRTMVAALSGRALYFPVWSPDNRWLILGLPDPDDPVDGIAQALVELSSCRVIPLPDLGGEVYSWGREQGGP